MLSAAHVLSPATGAIRHTPPEHTACVIETETLNAVSARDPAIPHRRPAMDDELDEDLDEGIAIGNDDSEGAVSSSRRGDNAATDLSLDEQGERQLLGSPPCGSKSPAIPMPFIAFSAAADIPA